MSKLAKQRNRRRWRRNAVVLVFVAVCALVFVGLVGLSADYGLVLSAGQQLQIAADAAALAGTQLIKSDTAPNFTAVHTRAKSLASANYVYRDTVQLADSDIIVGKFNRNTDTFTPTTNSPDAVRVIARRSSGSLGGPLPLVFGRAFGVNSVDVTRDAIAMISIGAVPGLLVLDPAAPNAFDKSGSGTLDVVSTDNNCGGAVQVNSANATAARSTGGTIKTTDFHVNGGASMGGTTLTDPCQIGNNPLHDNTGKSMSDLLAYLQNYEPNSASMTPRPAVPSSPPTIVLLPGYYATGITRASGTVTLTPGLYFLGGVGLSITGTTTFCAHGVCLFIKGASARVILTSTSAMSISPIDTNTTVSCNGTPYPSPMGANAIYQGVSIFQSAIYANPANAATITGTSSMDNNGVFYFPSVTVNISASGTPPHFINQLTANKVVMTGTGTIRIRFDGQQEGDFQGQFPGKFPAPAPTSVFLVE